jgi:hypothetical protein
MDEITEIRKDLKKFCPAIYEYCFADLNDAELLTTLETHRGALLANQGEVMVFAVQFPGEKSLRVIDTFVAPNKPEAN